MKRFWLEELWHWARTAVIGKMSGINVCATFAILVLMQLVPSSYAVVDQDCELRALLTCSSHEVCVQTSSTSTTGVCKCESQLVLNKATGKCEKDDPSVLPVPASSHLGLTLGLGLTFFLLFVVVALILAHRKLGLFSGMCDNLPRLRIFGRRGQDISLADNDDDDVNPIV
ncbi:uncharacterized protein [Procambarus clarkii]|uniref:uncharacterized protein n=1 Tax=Procambarus clarkii TaxID=6728 RepID=UPI001E675259|nr:uncharacterized protein LOC123759454 [Procambarus clarkii]